MSTHNRAIGKNGKLLWHIPEDLKRFKDLTKGHPVIMGRKTFESILSYLGKPLPERTNIVVTRNAAYNAQGVKIFHSLEDALSYAKTIDAQEIHIGGGSDIYAQALPYVDRLYLTLIDEEKEADSFFPDYSAFTKEIERVNKKTSDGIYYTWLTVERP